MSLADLRDVDLNKTECALVRKNGLHADWASLELATWATRVSMGFNDFQTKTTSHQW